MAASTFRAIYTLSGAPIFSKGWGIAASEDWSRGSVVAFNSSGVLAEPSADNADVLGIALEKAVSGATTGPLTTVCLVAPFTWDTVFAVKQTADLTVAPAVTDIGNDRDLELDGTNGWGIHASSSATAATPNFRIIDIDTIRNEWHVVPSSRIGQVFQWIDANV
jgi:hypothetical protein